jgi:hypothetical protein
MYYIFFDKIRILVQELKLANDLNIISIKIILEFYEFLKGK